MQTTRRHDGRETEGVDRSESASGRDWSDAPSEDVLELLGDEYACRILTALDAEPLPAVDLVERCDASRSTVYRRLDRLEAVGLVETSLRPERDGHHRTVFHLVVDEIRLRVGADGVDGRIAVADRAAD
jgi:DNA-binding HxlR family transcriptional regulator